MKVQNRINKQIIDVPFEHANTVLLRQGMWLPYEEPKVPVETQEIKPVKSAKKAGRPKKVK